MDSRQREYIEKAIEQGETFARLQEHPSWPVFRAWLEKLQADYDRKLHAELTRADHVALVRAAEGHDVVKNLLAGFDRAINDLAKNREQLDAADKPAA